MRGWLGSGVVVAFVVAVAVAFVVASVGFAGPAMADRALDRPAFTATPAELLAAAKAAPAGDWPAVVLREQCETSYDERSRAVVRERWVYVVRTQAGVDEWGTLRAAWRPFYQDRPALRARVIGPAGDVADLDPALITDGPSGHATPDVLSDQRSLAAPLPRLQVGSVVEYEAVITDREPPPGGASVALRELGNTVPTSSTVVVFSAPVGRPLHRAERGLPAGVHPRHQIIAGRDRWTYELPALPPRDPPEAAVPGDVVVWPYVGAAVAASWPAVVRDYGALVDRRIAEGPFALPAELPHTPSGETIDAIAAWLRKQVRYTGVELGEASIVPWPPAEIVKRGFGDCKDQATLLVALLRQAQIPADLVLLATAPGIDVDPDLPGLGQFDHAIVRARLGSREIWIDPTEDLMRPGQLPWRDQGRRALVIAAGTTALGMTPLAAPADNLIREVRDFTAAEDGPAQLTVVARPTGVFDASQRTWFRDQRSEDLDKLFRDVADKRFGGTLTHVGATDPADLATPFAVTFAVKDSSQVLASNPRIDVWLYPQAVLKQLPEAATEKPQTPRVHDFVWRTPAIYEVENRITVPPGFTLPAAAPDRVVSLGSATFSERRRVEDQTLSVTFRFETGKPRLSPAELQALQGALHSLDEEVVHIPIERTAFALADAGKLREAVAEAERMIALHPRESLHHGQLAELYLRAGAGEAARREARKAVELGPGKAAPLIVLGWVLGHDRLGRQYVYDWDRAGAIAALQKARALDPRHVGAVSELARVLERGASGVLFEPDADLRGAAEAWRAALALDHDTSRAVELARVLIWSDDAAQAERVARGAAVSAGRDAWIVTAVAEARGAKEAIRVAGELRSGEERDRLIGWAFAIMQLRRHHDTARALYAELAVAHPMPPAQTAMLEHLARHPDPPRAVRDPRSAVTDLLLAIADPRRKSPVFWDAALEGALRNTIGRVAPDWPRGFARTEMVADALTSSTVRVEGDAGLWRAHIEFPGKPLWIYLVLDRGTIKVVGTSELYAYTARHVLNAPLADARAIAQARQLLDWIRSELDAETANNAVAFRRIWGPGYPSSPEALRVAAAVLGGWLDPDRAIPVVKACKLTLPDAPRACRRMLVDAYTRTRRWADAVVELDAMRADPEEVLEWLGTYGDALIQGGRFDDADRLVEEVLAKHPDHASALFLRYRIALERGQMDVAAKRADAIAHRPHVEAGELNNLAWFELGVGSDLAGALDLARRAVQGARSSYPARNTLAAIEAELGDLGRAELDNRAAMELSPSSEPGAADWYVAARIDEQLGLVDDAIAIYRRIGKPDSVRFSTAAYAYRRLAALRRAP